MSPSHAARPFTVGLVQMRCSTDPDDNVRRAVRGAPRGGAAGGAGRLPARAVPHAVFLPGRGRRALRPRRADPRTDDRGAGRRRAGDGHGRRRLDLRAAARPGSTTTRRSCSTPTARSAAVIARCTSPTTRSITRSTTSPPATSGSRRSTPQVARVGTLVCWDQWYPEAARLTALQGAEILVLSDGHRLASRGEGRVRRGPGRGLGDHPARARHQQRRVRRGRQPGRPRGTRGGRPRILGRLVPRRSLRPRPRQGRPRHRGGPRRRPATPGSRKRPGATGPSSATGGSTPMARSPSGSSTQP